MEDADDLYLILPLFVEGEEEQRCAHHLISGKTLTISGLTPSGKRRQLSGVVKSLTRGTKLHPGYPLMLTIREKIQE
jgi:hypothetical protein